MRFMRALVRVAKHLDITLSRHQDINMRTTLTLDDDVAERLRGLAAHNRGSFKATVNAVLRRGLTAQERASRGGKPFRLEPFRSAFRAGVDPIRLNQAYDDLEAEHALERATAEGET
ncbi:MAG: hypothetical protein HY744_24715 [Deltaproteobacteria bacterium]|nr:hypothetical protein [Deltaproteobacteria bacterium]